MAEIANIYNEAGGEPPDEPYIKKTGDTATGLIVFNGGIEVNFGSTIIDGPAEFSDTVTFKPSADIIIECPVTFQGPSLIIGCDDTQFTGNTVEFNSPAVSIGNAGQGSLTLECGLDIGGFGSINMLNSSINMQDNSIINQFGTRPINNVLGSTNIINGSVLQFNSDLTQQTSAFTGAAALAGSYTNTNLTINSNGAISAISNGPTPSSLLASNNVWTGTNTFTLPTTEQQVIFLGNPSGSALPLLTTSGFQNWYNNNGKVSISGAGIINSTLVGNTIANKAFQISLKSAGDGPFPANPWTVIETIKLRVTYTFNCSALISPSGVTNPNFFWGQMSYDIDMFPNAWTQGDISTLGLPCNQYQNSNKINGSSNFYLAPSSPYTPNGRQFWTYNQSFSGLLSSEVYGYLVPTFAGTIGGGFPQQLATWVITLPVTTTALPGLITYTPVAPYNFSACLEVLDCTNANANGYGLIVNEFTPY